jgi:YD repeat-containing protein
MINREGNTGPYTYDGLGRRLASVADIRLGGTGSGAIDTTNPSNADGRVVADTRFDANSLARAVADDGSVSGDNNTSIGLIEATTPLGNVTRTTYDDLNRPTLVTFDDGTTRAYVYDRDDNVTQVTDQNGSVFVYAYDALNRQTQASVTPGAGVASRSTTLTYQYDALGRTTRATDNNDPGISADNSTLEFAYDSLGRLLEERQQIGAAPAAAVSSRYDGNGRRVALIYPSGRQIDYEYDAASRLVRVQDAAEGTPTATYSYIGSRLLERTYQNGVKLTMRHPTTLVIDGYDGARRPVRLRHIDGAGGAVADFEYALDRMGNRTEELRHHANAADAYTYDSLYRLTTFARDGTITPPAPGAPTNYTLDGNGNWDNQATDNNMNEYSVFQGNSRSYDNNGNLLMTGTMPTEFGYQHDAWNRLTAITTGGGGIPVTDYRYDAMGRATSKTVTNSGSFDDSVGYTYDGASLIVADGGVSGQKDFVGYRPVVIDRPYPTHSGAGPV